MLNTLGEIKTNGWTNLAMRQQKLKNDFQGILSCILSLIILKTITIVWLWPYLLHFSEHPEEVEPSELAEVLQGPGPGVQQRHEQLGVVADIRQTHGDPALGHFVIIETFVGEYKKQWTILGF